MDTLLLMMFLGLRKLGNICCGHKMFLSKFRNIFCVPDTKFVSATKCCARGQTGKHLCRQQCVRNNVFSFARAFKLLPTVRIPFLAINSMAPPPDPDLLLNKTVPVEEKYIMNSCNTCSPFLCFALSLICARNELCFEIKLTAVYARSSVHRKILRFFQSRMTGNSFLSFLRK